MSKRHDNPDEITISWHISDVQEVRPDLSDDEARQVLQRAKDQHDANIGVNWYVLQIVADILFPE